MIPAYGTTQERSTRVLRPSSTPFCFGKSCQTCGVGTGPPSATSPNILLPFLYDIQYRLCPNTLYHAYARWVNNVEKHQKLQCNAKTQKSSLSSLSLHTDHPGRCNLGSSELASEVDLPDFIATTMKEIASSGKEDVPGWVNRMELDIQRLEVVEVELKARSVGPLRHCLGPTRRYARRARSSNWRPCWTSSLSWTTILTTHSGYYTLMVCLRMTRSEDARSYEYRKRKTVASSSIVMGGLCWMTNLIPATLTHLSLAG